VQDSDRLGQTDATTRDGRLDLSQLVPEVERGIHTIRCVPRSSDAGPTAIETPPPVGNPRKLLADEENLDRPLPTRPVEIGGGGFSLADLVDRFASLHFDQQVEKYRRGVVFGEPSAEHPGLAPDLLGDEIPNDLDPSWPV
jgi:hypothetical protein